MVKAMERGSDNARPEIWLADDNEDFWGTIQMILEPEYSIRCFATLPETEEALERGPLPKILLLDCRFYGDDEAGLKFLKKIRPKWPVLPIIMVSALDKQSTAFSNIAGFHQSKYVEKTPAGFVATLKNTVAEAFPKSSLNMDLENRLCCTNLTQFILHKNLKDLPVIPQTAIECYFRHLDTNGVSVEKLSETCGYSIPALNESFKQNFNMKTGECLRYMSTIIGGLLVESGMGVEKAASRVGLTYETFRKHCHTEFECSPRELSESGSEILPRSDPGMTQELGG
ncbi:MAG: response regulator [bacterium]